MNLSITHRSDLPTAGTGMFSLAKNKRLLSVHSNSLEVSGERLTPRTLHGTRHDLPQQPPHWWTHPPIQLVPHPPHQPGDASSAPNFDSPCSLINLCPSFSGANWQVCLSCTLRRIPGLFSMGENNRTDKQRVQELGMERRWFSNFFSFSFQPVFEYQLNSLGHSHLCFNGRHCFRDNAEAGGSQFPLLIG